MCVYAAANSPGCIGVLSREDLTEYLYRVTGGGTVDNTPGGGSGGGSAGLVDSSAPLTSTNSTGGPADPADPNAPAAAPAVPAAEVRPPRTGRSCLSDEDIEYMVDQVRECESE